MDNNSLFLAVLILIAGIAVAAFMKKDQFMPEQQDVKVPPVQNDWVPKQTQPELIKPETKPALPSDPYLRALAEAKASGKKVFLYFGGESCPACIKMKQTTLSDASVKKALESFIVYEANTSKPDGMKLATKFNITLIPAYKILDGNEAVLKEGTGNTMNPRQFINWLESAR